MLDSGDSNQHTFGDELRTETPLAMLYLMRLPPNRIKIGFTDNLDRRLRDVMTWVPDFEEIKTWDCARSWEATTRKLMTGKIDGLRNIPNRDGKPSEVYEVRGDYEGTIRTMIERADQVLPVFQAALNPNEADDANVTRLQLDRKRYEKTAGDDE